MSDILVAQMIGGGIIAIVVYWIFRMLPLK